MVIHIELTKFDSIHFYDMWLIFRVKGASVEVERWHCLSSISSLLGVWGQSSHGTILYDQGIGVFL